MNVGFPRDWLVGVRSHVGRGSWTERPKSRGLVRKKWMRWESSWEDPLHLTRNPGFQVLVGYGPTVRFWKVPSCVVRYEFFETLQKIPKSCRPLTLVLRWLTRYFRGVGVPVSAGGRDPRFGSSTVTRNVGTKTSGGLREQVGSRGVRTSRGVHPADDTQGRRVGGRWSSDLISSGVR